MDIILIFGFLFVIATLALYVFVIVGILTNDDIDNNNKIFWVAMILLLNLLGLIVYLLVNEKNVLK